MRPPPTRRAARGKGNPRTDGGLTKKGRERLASRKPLDDSGELLGWNRFARAYKRLHDNVAANVDAAVLAVADDPTIGERKKGDLTELFVYKFRSQDQSYLLGYTVDDAVRLIYLEAVGPHEDFYRDLKRS